MKNKILLNSCNTFHKKQGLHIPPGSPILSLWVVDVFGPPLPRFVVVTDHFVYNDS